jgi:hypothetical protein
MIAKPVVLGLLAAACVTAAAGGAYVAVRQNHASSPFPLQTAAPEAPVAQPVAETEAVVTPPPATVEPEVAPKPAAVPDSAKAAVREPAARPAARAERTSKPAAAPSRTPAPSRNPAAAPTVARTGSDRPVQTTPTDPAVERSTPVRDPAGTAAPPVVAPLPVSPEPPPAPRRQLVEVVVPASSVVGLRVDTPLSSETARVEDRVEARVTRDVMADGRVAIPSGSRVLGDVVLVERGGKMKDKARLGVRFHTLVLADGNHVPFRTDSIFREGSSPGAESAKKIGGAAIGGAVLGAIIGGAKGAAIGGATGAAGGSAVVMAGDRNAATLPGGTIVTVRMSSPVTLDVEREP